MGAITGKSIWDRSRIVASTLVLMAPGLMASTSTPNPVSPAQISTIGMARVMEQRELQLSRSLIRASQFVDIPHIAEPACEQVEPPEALATPDPLFIPARRGERVEVSFIIGTDGRVHSPLILESAGMRGDRRVLDTVRSWRYRPATCNGEPTEIEGKIGFLVR